MSGVLRNKVSFQGSSRNPYWRMHLNPLSQVVRDSRDRLDAPLSIAVLPMKFESPPTLRLHLETCMAPAGTEAKTAHGFKMQGLPFVHESNTSLNVRNPRERCLCLLPNKAKQELHQPNVADGAAAFRIGRERWSAFCQPPPLWRSHLHSLAQCCQ